MQPAVGGRRVGGGCQGGKLGVDEKGADACPDCSGILQRYVAAALQVAGRQRALRDRGVFISVSFGSWSA